MKHFILSSLSIYFLYTLLPFIHSDCSIQRECADESSPSCQPQPAEGVNTKPRLFNDTNTLCPEFEGKERCCTPLQLRKLQSSFTSIESIFGKSAGGCDICVVNMKRFWCHFTCDPNQASFLKVIGYSNHTFNHETKRLLDLDLTINEDTNCKLFQSCKKTKFAAQVPAMGNAVGFTNFQGINAHTKNDVFIKVSVANEGGLTYNPSSCDTQPDAEGKVEGIKIGGPCTCNSCASVCNYTLSSSIPVLEGLSYKLVGGFYATVVVLSIVIFVVKNAMRKNKIKEKSDFEKLTS